MTNENTQDLTMDDLGAFEENTTGFEDRLESGKLREPEPNTNSNLGRTERNDWSKNPLVQQRVAKAAELLRFAAGLYKSRPAQRSNNACNLIGSLILDGKGPLPWECAALLDLVVSPKTIRNYNYIHGVGPEDLADTILNQFGGKQDSANAWIDREARASFFYGAVIHRLLVEKKQISKSPAAYFKTILQMLERPDEEGNHPLTEQLSDLPEFFENGTVLSDARAKIIANAALDSKERSIFVNTVQSWCYTFMQSEALRPWANSEESDFDIEQVLYGLRIGIATPSTEYGDAGVAIQNLAKARIYRAIKKRGNRRIELGQSKVLVIIDEAQRGATRMDVEILPEARSMDLIIIFATQNIDSLLAAFPGDEGKKLLESFRSIVSFKSSPATYAYIQERIGKARLITRSSGGTALDFGKTATVQLGSPYFDLNNPYRKWMRRLSMGGLLSRFIRNNPVHRQHGSKSETGETNLSGISHLTVSGEAGYIFGDSDIQKLNTPFHAIATVERGKGTRQDIIVSRALDDNFRPIDTSIESAEAVLEAASKANH